MYIFDEKYEYFGVAFARFSDFQALCGVSEVCLGCLEISWVRFGGPEPFVFHFPELYSKEPELEPRVRKLEIASSSSHAQAAALMRKTIDSTCLAKFYAK